MKTSVIGIVESTDQAEAILGALRQNGVSNDDVSVLFPDKGGTRDFAHEHKTKAPEVAVAGTAAGGVVGGTLGLLTGIGALAIPGLGPFIAAGPLMAALSGAAAGAAIGGVAGALIGMGIPEIEAKRYEGKINGGNVLMAVHVENAEARDRVRDILKNAGAHDVSTTSEAEAPKVAREDRVAR